MITTLLYTEKQEAFDYSASCENPYSYLFFVLFVSFVVMICW